MASVSLFEQLTSSVSLSMLAIISTAILTLLLVYTIACRRFFSSSKSQTTSSNKDKKSKQQNDTTSSNKKKNTKSKKNVIVASSSEEKSDNEPAILATPSTAKKVPATNENNKTKQSKTSNKQQISGKDDTATSNKKQPVAVNSEVKHKPIVDNEAGINQEDEGQWVIQSNKQINNRNRNKVKTETLPSSFSEKQPNKTESDSEPTSSPIENSEPIEICQLLPTNENPYTSNDNWWKQPLNHQQTFFVDDIGEWPEREQDEQYTVQIKRITPVKKCNQQQETTTS